MKRQVELLEAFKGSNKKDLLEGAAPLVLKRGYKIGYSIDEIKAFSSSYSSKFKGPSMMVILELRVSAGATEIMKGIKEKLTRLDADISKELVDDKGDDGVLISLRFEHKAYGGPGEERSTVAGWSSDLAKIIKAIRL